MIVQVRASQETTQQATYRKAYHITTHHNTTSNMEQHQQSNQEEYSVETPLPPAFLPYDQNSAALSYDEKHHAAAASTNNSNTDNVSEDDDDASFSANVRHGRNPRFYMIVAAAFLVVAAVGTGIGVAMSGGDSGDRSSVNQAVAEPDSKVGSESSSSLTPTDERDDKTTGEPGDAIEFGNSGNYGFDSSENTPVTPTTETAAPTNEVYDILLSHARFHGVEFEDPNSYQSRAARWVGETAQLGVHTPERLVQRYALASLYYATNGVANEFTDEIFGFGNPPRPWIDESGWLVNDDECSWYKITCNEDGQVTKIELHQNRLTGQLPPEVALLQASLEAIDLYQNLIHNEGPAQNDWLGELTNLRHLYFGRTYFSNDGIPTMIGRLTNLEEFDCSYTLYHGPLRGESFAGLSNLEYLHIGGNQYNSSIPTELAQLPKLQFLYAEYADLTGDLSFMKFMPAIIEMWVDRNPTLGGSIPSEIGLVTTLRSFSITGCNFEGSIPTELGNLRLQQAWFYNNSLTGSMPSAVCDTRYPDGRLQELEADCAAGEPFVCDCCTKCYPE